MGDNKGAGFLGLLAIGGLGASTVYFGIAWWRAKGIVDKLQVEITNLDNKMREKLAREGEITQEQYESEFAPIMAYIQTLLDELDDMGWPMSGLSFNSIWDFLKKLGITVLAVGAGLWFTKHLFRAIVSKWNKPPSPPTPPPGVPTADEAAIRAKIRAELLTPAEFELLRQEYGEFFLYVRELAISELAPWKIRLAGIMTTLSAAEQVAARDIIEKTETYGIKPGQAEWYEEPSTWAKIGGAVLGAAALLVFKGALPSWQLSPRYAALIGIPAIPTKPLYLTCPYCGYNAASREDMYMHAKEEHPGWFLIVCPYCYLVFADADQYTRHHAEEHASLPVPA